MSKLKMKLKSIEFQNSEILDRAQLKAISGGSFDCAAISHSCSSKPCCEGKCSVVELCQW